MTPAPIKRKKTTGKLISDAAKRRKEESRTWSELVIEGNRIYLCSKGHGPIQVRIDATPLWHFFKEVRAYQASKSV